ncbi:MAG: type I-B CRISPR-associated protein Cas8b1/Cst1 [Candidatus Thorarchaeota archaeon]
MGRQSTVTPDTLGREVLFCRTGNPFVDSGIAALCVLSGRKTPEEITRDDLRTQMEYIIQLYSDGDWKKAIHGMFFPNADLVNPSVKDGMGRYATTMEELLNAASSIHGRGDCVACGRRDGIFIDKTRVPLLGSQKLVNFFPAGSPGERFCPNCILASQFHLLAVEKVGIPLMLQCSKWEIQLAYARRIVNRVRTNHAMKRGGVVDDGFGKPAGLNAVYNAITEIIQDRDIGVTEDPVPLRFYHFTNYGQGPEIDMYDIPASVFLFLMEVEKSPNRNDWKKIVARGLEYVKRPKADTPKRSPNEVYQRLTEGKSILRFFIQKDRTVIGDWNLVSLYLRVVRGMSRERIETIRRVADQLLEFAMDSGSARRIWEIDSARTYDAFRTALVKVQAEMAKKMGRPLLTFDEYTLDIAPEGGASWRETRDLILFRVYERGASWLANVPERPHLTEDQEEEYEEEE